MLNLENNDSLNLKKKILIHFALPQTTLPQIPLSPKRVISVISN